MLTWKIVGASKVSVIYIYIYRLGYIEMYKQSYAQTRKKMGSNVKNL